ncbi:DUF692 domain-containing protein [Magnetovibrio sp. PR-2]|uniref:MNIO family bufferin maturase n=1 Tax=Magnetovibrio sp. PR-2 TaxID=3120356 RepID=UPI002FCE2177
MDQQAQTAQRSTSSIPTRAGIGLKAQHYQDILEHQPDIGWLEVHSENYMADGGPALRWLDAMRERFPLSLHGVGMSLGSAAPLDRLHLKRLVDLQRRCEPGAVSEHLSWSIANGAYLNDLIALPYTEECLEIFSTHVIEMQDALKRPVLIENPSSYLRYEHSVIPEPEFLVEVVKRTDCNVLLDVNNVYVSAQNHGFDAHAYIDQIPAEKVLEYHMAGHSKTVIDGRTIRVDDHGSPITDAVWNLFDYTVGKVGAKPTLIERDSNIPELDVLVGEAHKADAILARHLVKEDAHAFVG